MMQAPAAWPWPGPAYSLVVLDYKVSCGRCEVVAHMWLQVMQASKALPARPLNVGCVEKQHIDSYLEMLNMQMLGQAGCEKSYCLGAMSKLANEFM